MLWHRLRRSRQTRPGGAGHCVCVLVTALAGCSALQSIDVCRRSRGTEQQANHRTDGDQRLENTRSLVELPSGGALMTFTSMSSPDASEVRGALISDDGVTLRTCGADGEATWIAHDANGPARQLRQRPTLGRPLADGVYGLLGYAGTVDGSAELQVFAQTLDTSGCTNGAPLQLSAEPSGATINWLQVVSTAPREFMVIWAVAQSNPVAMTATLAIRARAVRVSTGLPIEFLPTVTSIDGATVDLVKGLFYGAVAAGERGDGGILLAWIETGTDAYRVHLSTYDPVLRQQADVVVSSTPYAPFPNQLGIDVLSDGNQALVAWIERDDAGVPRAFGRFYRPVTLGVLRAPESPGGDKFRLSTSARAIDEGFPNLTASPGGSLIAAWNETGDPTHDDQSGAGVRAILFGTDGGRMFADPACGNTDFQLNIGTRDNQLHPNTVLFADGTLLAAWSDYGQNGVDRFADNSGSGIRTIVLAPFSLRPL